MGFDILSNGGWCMQYIRVHPTPHFSMHLSDKPLSIIYMLHILCRYPIPDIR